MAENFKIGIPKLVADIERDHQSYVFFIGNGIPRLFGAKSWKDLCIELIRLCKKLPESKDKNEIIEYIEDLLKRNNTSDYPVIINRCKELFYLNNRGDIYKSTIKWCINQNGQQYEIYSKLFSLNPKHIVTTNIDECILPQNGYDIRDCHYQNLTVDGGIFYLHGKISDFENIVFSILEYDRRYGNTQYLEFFKYLLGHKILFMGYGFENELIHYLRLIPKEDRKNNLVNLCGMPRERYRIKNRENEEYFNNYKICTVEYPVQNNDWSGLVDIVNEIYSKLKAPMIYYTGEKLDVLR